MIRASSETPAKTTAAMRSRCQNDIRRVVRRADGRSSVEREGLPPREPVVEAVPVADLVLAEVPAEEHLLAVTERGEVDQARVEVLHLHAERPDRIDRRDDSLGRGADVLVE